MGKVDSSTSTANVEVGLYSIRMVAPQPGNARDLQSAAPQRYRQNARFPIEWQFVPGHVCGYSQPIRASSFATGPSFPADSDLLFRFTSLREYHCVSLQPDFKVRAKLNARS